MGHLHFCFFFSSRRRHTRYWRDWSSDVCSSDLVDYLKRDELRVEIMGRGMAWLDAGTHESLQQAGNFIETIEQRQGLKIGSPEEISYRKGYIDAEQLEALAAPMTKNDYGRNLLELLKDGGPVT